MPPPPPQTIKTTIRRAKAQYKKSGPQIAPAEQRRLARAVELDRRAQAAREREQRRKKAEKARAEREEKEREARRKLGIGFATQIAGYSLTQKQLKGGMEGWLGAGTKRKRDDSEVEEKENRLHGDSEGSHIGRTVPKREEESFGSNMSLDDVLLDQLVDRKEDGSISSQFQRRNNTTMIQPTEHGESPRDTPKHKLQEYGEEHHNTARESTSKTTITPVTKRVKTMSSPNDSWAQFLDGNTQIMQDISRSPPRMDGQATPTSPPPPMSTQDLEITSDDWFETGLPKIGNPALSPKEGIIIRDFAYFKHTTSGSFTLEDPGAPSLPRKSRTEKSMLRSFGQKPTIAAPSPKMTATCAAFTAAQCSFTSDYHHYGLSTQLLQQALDDGDDDTEDEDEEVYSQALEASKVPDKVLMPPPPLRLSPTVFKPPAKNDLFASKGGLQILGLSTQLLDDAISAAAADPLTDEDEDDGLFKIPVKRPTADTNPNTRESATTKHKTGVASTDTKKPAYHDFGLSTQVLQDAALDDIDSTDDEDTQGS
jgi:hypothetical protein